MHKVNSFSTVTVNHNRTLEKEKKKEKNLKQAQSIKSQVLSMTILLLFM